MALFLVLGLTDAWLLEFCRSVVLPAINSGIFPARGRVYLREMHPMRFWFGVGFFPALAILVSALMALRVYLLLQG